MTIIHKLNYKEFDEVAYKYLIINNLQKRQFT
jgi:hypothetical protein